MNEEWVQKPRNKFAFLHLKEALENVHIVWTVMGSIDLKQHFVEIDILYGFPPSQDHQVNTFFNFSLQCHNIKMEVDKCENLLFFCDLKFQQI